MASQLETAQQIWHYFTSRGWTPEAVAGLLGNMQSESGIIADRWESDKVGDLARGYGLVQWTPATKYIDWAKQNGLVYQEVISQCKRLEYEVENNIQWFYNPQRPDIKLITFKEFTQLTNVEDAADCFSALHEHPEYPNQPNRKTQARYWFEQLKNTTIIKKGEIEMKLFYSVDGKGPLMYFDGLKVRGLAHQDEQNILNDIYKANNGKDLPTMNFSSKAPYYARLLAVTNRTPV